jgi:hypothetical protein
MSTHSPRPTGSCKLSPYCEATSEERSAANPHATFCGSRRWETASGHPVGAWQYVSLPRSLSSPLSSPCLRRICEDLSDHFRVVPRFRTCSEGPLRV